MKKIIMAIAATAMLASAAFAEVSLGGWGRGYFNPVEVKKADGKDAEVKADPAYISWGGDKIRTGITASGSSDNNGFTLQINEGGIASGSIWAKPFDFLTLTLGHGEWEDLSFRGDDPNVFLQHNKVSLGGNDADDNDSGWWLYNGGDGDAVFTRINAAHKDAACVKVNFEPVTVYACVNGAEGKAEDVYKNGQYGIAANLDGIGLARAQYLGRGKEGTIEAAFKLTSVENLYLDAGIKYDTEKKFTVAALAGYTAGDFSFKAPVKFVSDNSGDKAVNSLGIAFDPSYNLGNGLSVWAELGYNCGNLENADKGVIGADVYLQKGLASGRCCVGAAFAYNMGCKVTAFSVPVMLEYWF